MKRHIITFVILLMPLLCFTQEYAFLDHVYMNKLSINSSMFIEDYDTSSDWSGALHAQLTSKLAIKSYIASYVAANQNNDPDSLAGKPGADYLDSKWTESGGNINRSTGKVGIGIASPVTQMHINENSTEFNYLQFTNDDTGTAITDGATFGLSAGEDFLIWQREAKALRFGTSSTERMRITSDGKVGIGTTSPSNSLTLGSGNLQVTSLGTTDFIKSTSGVLLSGSWSGVDLSDLNDDINAAGKWTESGGNINRSTGKVGIGIASPVTQMHINENSTEFNYLQFTNDDTGTAITDGATFGLSAGEDFLIWQREAKALRFGTSSTERMRVTSDGKVGIGGEANGVGILQVEGLTGNVYLSRLESATTSGYSFIQTTTSGSGGVDGFRFGLVGLNAEIKNLESGTLTIGTANSNSLYIASDQSAFWNLPSSTAFAFDFLQGSDSYLNINTSDKEIEVGTEIVMRDEFNGYGTSHSTSDEAVRLNAANFHFPSSVTSNYIHIEFDYIPTSTASDFTVQVIGSLFDDSQTEPLRIWGWCEINSSSIPYQDTDVYGTTTVTWYRSSAGRPVLRITNSGGDDIGDSRGTVNVYAGTNMTGSNPAAPKVRQIVASDTNL